jgi:hypothetical protein
VVGLCGGAIVSGDADRLSSLPQFPTHCKFSVLFNRSVYFLSLVLQICKNLLF